MAFPTLRAPHTGASASAGMGALNHGRSMQMAHAAANRLATARALSGSAGAPGAPGARLAGPNLAHLQTPQNRPQAGDWRAGVSAMVAHGAGKSVGPNEIHQAVGKLVQAGQFTPNQGMALVKHVGPLQGAAGHMTMRKVAHVAAGGALPAPPGAMPVPQAGAPLPVASAAPRPPGM